MNYNYPINFRNINPLFWTPTESFENLCKEFIEQEYETKENFVLWNPSNYPWIEAKPIETWDWMYISFQAKYSFDKNDVKNQLNKSFWRWWTCKIEQEDLNLLDILVIICPCYIGETAKKRIEENLKKEKESLSVIFFTGKEFETVLQQEKYVLLRQKYFYNENVERERQDSNRHDADKSMIIPFIGLCWTPWEKEISLANKEYNEYQMNKLCYIWTDCYIAFNEMEDDILNNIGTTLEWESERQDDFSLWKLLEATRKEIETMITTNPKWSRIKYFLPNGSHKRWVTLQHHQDKKITIKIRDSKAIYQINDENEWNDRDG